MAPQMAPDVCVGNGVPILVAEQALASLESLSGPCQLELQDLVWLP